MRADTPDRHLGFLLHDVARLLRTRFDQRARVLGLSRAQWSVLAHLSRNEGIRQNALADILEVEPITLARLLDRLEESGLVERRIDPSDRRARRLFVCAAAHPLLERMRELGAATREEALLGIAPERREELIETLLEMKRNLSSRTPTPAEASEPVLEAVNG
jgi:MarR family transcriptional regulator, transcriptional regulator for hemolysin